MQSSSQPREYSGGPVLALDTGSPQVSVALAADGVVLASRSLPQASSSRELLPAVDQVLKRCGLRLQDLGGLIALSGPGSFTGLRVGLATALGLHQALGIPATTLPTLEILASSLDSPETVVAAIDARREEWVLQAFSGFPRQPLGPFHRCSSSEIPAWARGSGSDAANGPIKVLGFGISTMHRDPAAWQGVAVQEPPPLAASAALAPFRSPVSWTAQALTQPIYFRPPAVTPAKR